MSEMSDHFSSRAQLLTRGAGVHVARGFAGRDVTKVGGGGLASADGGREVGRHAYRTAVPHSTAVRLSQFWILMEDEFGPTYAVSLARDLALDALGGRTAQEALDAGLPPRDVWLGAVRRAGRRPRAPPRQGRAPAQNR